MSNIGRTINTPVTTWPLFRLNLADIFTSNIPAVCLIAYVAALKTGRPLSGPTCIRKQGQAVAQKFRVLAHERFGSVQ
jgi:hypothetical protein